MRLLRALLGGCLALVLGGGRIGAQDRWDQADRHTQRLPPAAFSQLPRTVRRDLERRGCTIPQVWADREPGNVIRGHFRSPGRLDWAVLCSVDRVSTILVYWAGRPDSMDELASAADRDFLQGVGRDSIGFSRAIHVVDAGFLREHLKGDGKPAPRPIDHDGIDDALVEKGSVVRYWYQGAWLELPGAD